MISRAQLQRIMPRLSDARAHEFYAPLSDAMHEFGINTPAREAAFLAQLAHESGEFRYMEELADGIAYNGRADLGNTSIEARTYSNGNPGPWFKGHGPIQITGFNNHRDCSLALFGDDTLLHAPLMLTEPVTGCRGACWFWTSRDLNELADAAKFGSITRRVNGGYNGLDDRCKYWARGLVVLNVDT